MNASITPALLAAISVAFPDRRNLQEVMLGMLEGLILHNGRAFPVLSGADLEILVDARVLERVGKRMTLRRDPTTGRKFTDELCAIFEEIVDRPYVFSARDGVALADLMRRASQEEVLVRWRLGLSSTGWLQTATISQLALKWNDLAAPKGIISNSQVREGDKF